MVCSHDSVPDRPRSMARIQEHFLFVTDPLQSHINPARRLAVRVSAAMPNARVTFSTAVSGHRHMFPHLTCPDGEVLQGVVSYIPYSDGFVDGGFNPDAHGTVGVGAYRERARAVGTETLTAIISRLARRGHPVTRVVYTALVGWVPAVARAHGVPAALYWVKPATVFAVYYHYIHGHGCVSDPEDPSAAVLLPGLPPLKPDALPSFASMTTPGSRYYLTLDMLRDIFLALDEDEDRPTVLVDTFDALEPEALRAVPRFNLLAVGPVVVDEPCRPCMEMFQPDDAKAYVEWLDTKPARSVVFASFVSVLSLSKRQDEELRRGLEATGRPYLLVAARKSIGSDGSGRGMVAEWCNQTKVLSHHAVGCFVTHCRWDSALESITGGVPMVAVPRWGDQPAVAALVEASQGVGVRARLDGEGVVVERGELLRCVEAVMGSTESAAAVRARAERLRQRAKEAAAVGGTSHRSLLAFASGM